MSSQQRGQKSFQNNGELINVQTNFRKFAASLYQSKENKARKSQQQYFECEYSFEKVQSPSAIQQLLKKRVLKIQSSGRIKKNWSPQDVRILTWIVTKFAQKNGVALQRIQQQNQFWPFISSLIPGTNAESCKFKWLSLMKCNLATHVWTVQESELLNQIIKQEGRGNWKLIAQKLYNMNQESQKVYRQPKQCRQHWSSFLKPNVIKGPWTAQQDKQLLRQIIKKRGSKKWFMISETMPTRTQNAIKNRYNLLIKKIKKGLKGKRSQLDSIKQYLKSQAQVESSNKQKLFENKEQAQHLNSFAADKRQQNNQKKQVSDEAKKNKRSQQIVGNYNTQQNLDRPEFEVLNNFNLWPGFTFNQPSLTLTWPQWPYYQNNANPYLYTWR